jgi:hypothetical protein
VIVKQARLPGTTERPVEQTGRILRLFGRITHGELVELVR